MINLIKKKKEKYIIRNLTLLSRLLSIIYLFNALLPLKMFRKKMPKEFSPLLKARRRRFEGLGFDRRM
jgi:hypothetical protein